MDAAISLFGDKNAGGIVLLRKYADYYHGYMDEQGKYHQGYTDMIDDLTQKFPLTEPQIVGEQNQKNFYRAVWCAAADAELVIFL